jgi:hypothetical protein
METERREVERVLFRAVEKHPVVVCFLDASFLNQQRLGSTAQRTCPLSSALRILCDLTLFSASISVHPDLERIFENQPRSLKARWMATWTGVSAHVVLQSRVPGF